ncbi:preprotein translocase subunit SecE [Candidatus Falkowbacteria bacterium]|nr:preprotein translocase subunit SecE [Candidatus Falkowbacteria bacterium]
MANKIVEYFKESKVELKKVTWPTKKETTKHTALVIGISLVLAAFLGLLDYIFSFGFEYLINR